MTRPVCAIVGGGSGLGTGLARTFAGDGFDIALLSRSESGSQTALEAAKAADGEATVRYFTADATDPDGLMAALASVASEMGPVEVLIYNVRGGFNMKSPLDMTAQDLREVFELEVVGAHAAAKAVIPAMIEAGHGTVIYSSATAALRGSATNPTYAIGKFALRALSQSLAKAYNKDRVHVAHVRLDAMMDVPIVRQFLGDKFDEENVANTDDVAQSYLWIHKQPRSAWSNEVELRPYTEDWTY